MSLQDTILQDPGITKMKPTVKLISATPDAEKHIAYCARVSNPKKSRER